MYTVKSLETLKDLIFLIDGYRVHHYEEIRWVERAVKAGDLGWKFRQDWDGIKRILTKTATLPKPLSHLFKWAKIQVYIRFIGLVVSTLTMLLLGVTFFFQWGRMPGGMSLIATTLGYIAVPLIISIMVSFLGPPLIARKIDRELSEYRQKNPRRFRIFDLRLKATAQNLIDSLVHQVKTSKMGDKERLETSFDLIRNVDSAYKSFFGRIFKRREKRTYRHSFELFNVDYSGIKIIKKPSLFRKFYIVAPEIERHPVAG